MMLVVLLVLLAHFASHFTNGQDQCTTELVSFSANNPACFAAFNVADDPDAIDDPDINATDLICNNTECQAAIASYVNACSSRDVVSSIGCTI